MNGTIATSGMFTVALATLTNTPQNINGCKQNTLCRAKGNMDEIIISTLICSPLDNKLYYEPNLASLFK